MASGNGDADEDLLVFGYACKVYRDDDRALQTEKALIPWMGDPEISMDRYDCRGHLSSLAEFEPRPGAWDEYTASLGPEEAAEEQMVDEERWLSMNEEAEEARDEILKRAAAPAENFAEIGFIYENEDSQTDPIGAPNRPNDFVDPDDKPYKVPKGLTLPVTVPRPETRREHTIIEKTAEFIARQGGQLEVLIRMKQKNNAQFAFLDIEHKLNLYYRFLVQQIRTGAYRPTVFQNGDESNSDSESDSEGGYLHPSLFASKNTSTMSSGPPEALKNIFKAQASSLKGNCAYSQLIDKIRPSLLDADQEASNGPSENASTADSRADSNDSSNHAQAGGGLEAGSVVELEALVAVMPPPPDIQPIVDKMAEYVAKNGVEFEDQIRAKGDPKFSFVDAGDEFYAYYQFKLQEFRSMLTRTSKKQAAESNASVVATPTKDPAPDPIGEKVEKKSPNALERIALENSLHTSPERTPRDRRIEKRKKTLKISLKSYGNGLKAKEDEAAGGDKPAESSEKEKPSLIGPTLPSLYDDEDDVEVREDILEDLSKSEKKVAVALPMPAAAPEEVVVIDSDEQPPREKQTASDEATKDGRRRSGSPERARSPEKVDRSAEGRRSHERSRRHRRGHSRDRSRSRERTRRNRSRERHRSVRDDSDRDRKRERRERLPSPEPVEDLEDEEEARNGSLAKASGGAEDELRKKQLERKKKLAAFLSMVKGGTQESAVVTEKKEDSGQVDLKAKIRNLKRTLMHSDDEVALGEADSRRPTGSGGGEVEVKLPSICVTKDAAPKEESKRSKVDLKKLRKDCREDSEAPNTRSYDSDDDSYERRRRRSRDRRRQRSSSSRSSSSSPDRHPSKSRREHRKHHKSKSSRRHRN